MAVAAVIVGVAVTAVLGTQWGPLAPAEMRGKTGMGTIRPQQTRSVAVVLVRTELGVGVRSATAVLLLLEVIGAPLEKKNHMSVYKMAPPTSLLHPPPPPQQQPPPPPPPSPPPPLRPRRR